MHGGMFMVAISKKLNMPMQECLKKGTGRHSKGPFVGATNSTDAAAMGVAKPTVYNCCNNTVGKDSALVSFVLSVMCCTKGWATYHIDALYIRKGYIPH